MDEWMVVPLALLDVVGGARGSTPVDVNVIGYGLNAWLSTADVVTYSCADPRLHRRRASSLSLSLPKRTGIDVGFLDLDGVQHWGIVQLRGRTTANFCVPRMDELLLIMHQSRN